jgi:hypothetical protein
MPGMVLGDLVELCLLFLAAKPSHVRVDVDRLRAPALSNDMWPSDEGTELPVRCCHFPSCRSGWWHLSGGCKAPRPGYLMECWPSE